MRGRLKMDCKQISYLETPTREIGLKTPFLICDLYGGAHEDNECGQNNPTEQVCLSGGDINNDPSLVRNKFEDELANFMLEKKFHTNGIGEMLDQHRTTERKGPEGAESSTMQNEEAPRSSIFYQPFKSSNMSFPSRVKKQKKDDDNE
ncbi:hypothetical protein Tco_0409010 [Tanacetum coccineum]